MHTYFDIPILNDAFGINRPNIIKLQIYNVRVRFAPKWFYFFVSIFNSDLRYVAAFWMWWALCESIWSAFFTPPYTKRPNDRKRNSTKAHCCGILNLAVIRLRTNKMVSIANADLQLQAHENMTISTAQFNLTYSIICCVCAFALFSTEY